MPVSLESQVSAFSRAINKSVPFMLLSPFCFSGKDSEENDIVRIRLPGAGEGYFPNLKSRETPKLIGLDGIEMKFDPAGIQFTLYPIK